MRQLWKTFEKCWILAVDAAVAARHHRQGPLPSYRAQSEAQREMSCCLRLSARSSRVRVLFHGIWYNETPTGSCQLGRIRSRRVQGHH